MADYGELKETVNEAYSAVADLTEPEFKLEGFKIVLSSMLGGGKTNKLAVQHVTEDEPQAQGPTSDWQSAIAARLHISTQEVARIYHQENEGELRLILDTKILPKNSLALATQHIAALICAGRQAAKIDEGHTSFEVIRKECVEYGVLNKSNFTSYLRKMKPRFLVEGKGTSQSMRVTAPGFDQAAEYAKKYLGQDQ